MLAQGKMEKMETCCLTRFVDETRPKELLVVGKLLASSRLYRGGVCAGKQELPEPRIDVSKGGRRSCERSLHIPHAEIFADISLDLIENVAPISIAGCVGEFINEEAAVDQGTVVIARDILDGDRVLVVEPVVLNARGGLKRFVLKIL